ncbi:small integral membrane protein 29-like [Dreissena polymorpha]|uniref:Small integral membrane protein 29 n=1 Tax=Dreissena polymorpha TaxID=45954 RepID=A0A9D4NEF4_DREPO|nr:small integral membrane protein 29-like [Dreissena polymorpha]KAH3892811.1 hypothetical protein DPMN_016941 [Dreissena polymorpha]
MNAVTAATAIANSSFANETVQQTISTLRPSSAAGNHAVAYIVIPLGCLVLIIVFALVIMMIFKRNRMERLRHHLMPLYNFDPQEEDWESELLDDKGRRTYYKDGATGSTVPQLQFNT